MRYRILRTPRRIRASPQPTRTLLLSRPAKRLGRPPISRDRILQPSALGQPGAPGQPGTAPGQSPFGSLNGQVGNPADLQKPTGPVDGPVLGAFLTGVASKVDAPSQKVYHHGKKYIQWEFVWNPLEEAAANMQQSLNPQGQQPGIGSPTSNPFGQPTTGMPQPQPQQQSQPQQ